MTLSNHAAYRSAIRVRRYGSPVFHNAIEGALRALPKPVRELVERVDFFCGIDPVWAGLTSAEASDDGRSLREIPYCEYRYTQAHLPADRRRTTIVLPTERAANIPTVRHELGHALHEILGWFGPVRPITEYAKTSAYEAFAEAFCAWREPRYCGRDLRLVDPRADALFTMVSI
jgi:hypothetical protein